MPFTLPPDSSPLIAQILAHWDGMRPGPDLLPARRHFDPAALAGVAPDVLPHLWLLDIEPSPRRYRLRLIGTMLKVAGSPGRVGDYLDAVDVTGAAQRCLDEACRTRTPDYHRGPPALPHTSDVQELEVIYLPLAADGRNADIILACTVYHWKPGREPISLVLG